MYVPSDLGSYAYWDAALSAFERRSPEERLAHEPLGALIDADMRARASRSPPDREEPVRAGEAGPSVRPPARPAPRRPAPAPAGRTSPVVDEARILDHIGVPARPVHYTRADIDACRSDARNFRWPSACTVEACRRAGRCMGRLLPLAGAPAPMPACLRLLARRRWGPGRLDPEEEARVARMLAPLRGRARGG